MRTLQAIVVMLGIALVANAPALSQGYHGSSNRYQATIAIASLSGLMMVGSRAASADRPTTLAVNCQPGYVHDKYYRCVPAQRLSHPPSTPSTEKLPSAAQRNAFACSQKGLMPGGDAGVVNGDKCLCPPPLRTMTGSLFVSSRNECVF